MKKIDLITKLAEENEMSKAEVERMVNRMFELIVSEMKSGGSCDFSGFGKFEATQRAARTARNPRTGEAVQVPARMAPKFKPAKALKDALN